MLSSTQMSECSDDGLEPIRGDLGASIMGPRNLPQEQQNPDLLASPCTDAGTIPNRKFSFAVSAVTQIMN